MSVETQFPSDEPDIDPSMGEALQAHKNKVRLIHTAKIASVWIALVLILSIGLLQLRFDPGYVGEHYGFVMQGVLTTLGLSVASIAIATILALLGALGRLSHNSIAQGLAGFYVSLVRGTPLLIQIYIIYLGLPQIGTQLQSLGFAHLGKTLTLTAIQSGILALSLNYGAYMTEIFRAGIQSISHGQREAAISLGLTEWQTMRRVILPQAIRIIIPDIGNQFIAMQKDSALVSVMGVWEITYRANRFGRKDSKFMEMFILAAALYWILTIVSSWIEERLEKRLAHAYER
ncbi:MAG: amino acid ABC transporter permease [Anaerolineales bacterium]|nr:amino acid ABC transporter permease [Anaerolineales bacterium]